MRGLTPHQGPQPGGLASREGAPRAFRFEGQQIGSQELHRTGGNRTPLLEDAHKVSCAPRAGKKQWLHRNLGKTYLLVLEGLLRRWGQLSHTMGTRTLVTEVPESTHWCELSCRLPFWYEDLAHQKVCRHQCCDASGQTISRAGTQPHLSADRLPVFLSSQPCLNTQIDMALPTRGTR